MAQRNVTAYQETGRLKFRRLRMYSFFDTLKFFALRMKWIKITQNNFYMYLYMENMWMNC